MGTVLKSIPEVFIQAAKRKALRESRTILVYRDASGTPFLVSETFFDDENERLEVLRRFDPPEPESCDLVPVGNHRSLEPGDRVLVASPDGSDVRVVTKISGGMRIFVNGGESFRIRDGVQWGGGDLQITHREPSS